MTQISIIVATDENNAIGKNNTMLCHLPNDLKFFKATTAHYPIIMGRKTFESLPKGALPNRRNIVISRNAELQFEGCEMCTSLEEALNLCKDEEQLFIIGGGMIYKQALPLANDVYLTRIRNRFEGAEIYFPELEAGKWKELWREQHLADEKHKYDYTFIHFEKIIS